MHENLHTDSGKYALFENSWRDAGGLKGDFDDKFMMFFQPEIQKSSPHDRGIAYSRKSSSCMF